MVEIYTISQPRGFLETSHGWMKTFTQSAESITGPLFTLGISPQPWHDPILQQHTQQPDQTVRPPYEAC